MNKILEVVKVPPQFLLFSATIPEWVKEVAWKYLNKKYEFIDLCKDLTNKTSHTVNHLAMNVLPHNRIQTLVDVLQCYQGMHGKCIVFCETKVEANSVILNEKVKNMVEVLHGDIA